MHRIDTPTAQTDKFGEGKNGFTRGNPQTGVPATALDDDYFDAIQEEIAGVIEVAGVVLNKGNRAQLIMALKKLFLLSSNNLSEIKSSGPAAVAQTLANLGLGDAAKRTVGISTGNIPDMSFFSSLLSGAGYQKLPGGLIIQWGTISGTIGQLSWPYPITFPNAVFQAAVTLSDKTAGANAGISLFAESVTFSSKTMLTVQPRGTDGLGTTTARFIVIGW